jgi:hypothetical protein
MTLMAAMHLTNAVLKNHNNTHDKNPKFSIRNSGVNRASFLGVTERLLGEQIILELCFIVF